MRDDQRFLQTVAQSPGVYQMYNANGDLLYIGKAHNLRKRLASYFRDKAQLTPKTVQLMSQVANIETIVTNTENEALLLESNLIKRYLPRYNVLLRDDKSYPYLYLSTHKQYPMLSLYRGVKKNKGKYFGPYPSVNAVRETLALLQKLFKLRQCNDTFFNNRSRPCLQYQIKRCTAPCVGYISAEQYNENVRLVELFLEGKNQKVIEGLMQKMEEASNNLDFEEAARYRDQIAHIRQIQSDQSIDQGLSDVDAVAAAISHGVACVNVLVVRQGQVVGSKPFFLNISADDSESLVLSEFLPQYYMGHPRGQGYPQAIIVNHWLYEQQWVQQALSEQFNKQLNIVTSPRGQRRQWQKLSIANAFESLRGHLSTRQTTYQRLEALQTALEIDSIPQRLECFDISHTQGENPVASAVVFDQQGPKKDAYRRFNIKNVQSGDDYAAIQQAVYRHFKKLKEKEEPLPDVLIIDGGRGQLHEAEKVLEELQVTGVVTISIAKGPGRKPGFETVYQSGRNSPLNFEPDEQALHLLQQVRDEAHRFALTTHRGQRGKKRVQSTLEDIAGIGEKRRQQLLQRFGGLQGLKQASVQDIARVPGISKQLAHRIYNTLHGK